MAEKYKIDEILDEEKLRGCHFNSSFMDYSKVIGNNHERTVDGYDNEEILIDAKFELDRKKSS